MLSNLTAKNGGVEIVAEEFREDGISGAISLSVPAPSASLESIIPSPLRVRFACARVSPEF